MAKPKMGMRYESFRPSTVAAGRGNSKIKGAEWPKIARLLVHSGRQPTALVTLPLELLEGCEHQISVW